ncbi:MAG TPA: histidine kinase, partial [Chitinophagaceae bacterium]|nr:histidine kinase [Chitinophagaceae bacterium]
MKIQLPAYNGKDNYVMIVAMPLFGMVINSIIFGADYFTNWQLFLLATIISSVAGGIDFILCGFVAVTLKQRFPEEHQLLKRLSLMIFTFLIISGLFLYSLFRGYELIHFFNYRFNEAGFVWSYFALGILNIFLTFLMEGIARFKDWEANWLETEKLKAVYKQSQLHGLKSQVNPHFLFNSLNSLSCLIQEDEEEAEKFLDEMSKVYRYLLHDDEEHLVPLEAELKFIDSYMHLLSARYGGGLQLQLRIDEADKLKLLPPLTLQVIIENIFTQNIISKTQPLVIEIASNDNGSIEVKNNIQPKAITDALDFDAGLDNLVKKYELLNQPLIVDDTNERQRIITIP